MRLVMALVVGPFFRSLPSSLPSQRGFVLKSNSSASSSMLPTKGIKSVTLKVTCSSYSSSRLAGMHYY